MAKRCLESEDINSPADGVGGVGMAELVGMEMNLRFPSPAAHPFGNRLTTQRTILPV